MTATEKKRIVIVGGGTAGITVAARLAKANKKLDIVLFEPSEKHHYQPLWTLIAAGNATQKEAVREEVDFIPKGVKWIKQRVVDLDPDQSTVTSEDGETWSYDGLVLAPGLIVDFGGIPGLSETIGKNGVCSIYDFKHTARMWEQLQEFKGGRALFTFRSPLKCGGAPQKIMYLCDEYFRKQGIRDKSEVHFFSSGGGLFGIDVIREALERVADRKEVERHFNHQLIEVRGDKKEAVFEITKEDGSKETVVESFDLLHVTPVMRPPSLISGEDLGVTEDRPPQNNICVTDGDQKGWLDVDIHTLQHKRYENIFGLGDTAALPTAKTGAAVRKQAPIVVHNLLLVLDGQSSKDFKLYNGYSSCPLVTGIGKVILAEFDYEGNLASTFPFDQIKERYSMWLLKRYALPKLYWYGMLRGRA